MMRQTLKAALFTAALLLLFAPAAQAATDPILVLTPSPSSSPAPPESGYLSGPCGIGVDSSGRFLVSDYYHHSVDVFNSSGAYANQQLKEEDPLDGPCGLALSSSNQLYVNNYHRNVVRFGAAPSFGSGTVFPLPEADTPHHLPTGVALDTSTNYVYVDHRSYVSVFDSAGSPILDEGLPLKIGEGSLAEGYGVAVSQYPSTAGRLYVPDASSNTVKVYDPSLDKEDPVAEIKDPFSKPFVSLTDSAIAVDRVTGDVYFADNLQPEATEKPQASIYVYSSSNSYKGRLKYNVIDALPVGLAVDNSFQSTQGRVYVTSGNTSQASVYAYGPGSATFAVPLPPLGSGLSAPGSSSEGGSGPASAQAPDSSSPASLSSVPPSASPQGTAQESRQNHRRHRSCHAKAGRRSHSRRIRRSPGVAKARRLGSRGRAPGSPQRRAGAMRGRGCSSQG